MNESLQQRFLFVLSRAPHAHSLARDSLDAIMTSALLNQTVSLLFVADGVFQLAEENWAGQIATLSEMAPIELYVSRHDMKERSLSSADLRLQARILEKAALSRLFDDHDRVLSF